MAIDAGRERAPYASNPGKSRGRRYPETSNQTRNVFRRDADRIIHATAFRRLKHKTQVFVFHEGDHYRTRLTHTLEVVQVARSLARSLGLDEDLAEGLALAHDLGHPPFGHAGERALDRSLAAYGGFDHNAQALRVVTELERRYPNFDGLNLTWEMLEGIVKHNGPLTDREGNAVGRYRERGVPGPISDYGKIQNLELWSFASAEAQVAAISDDIAYDAHDIDDGLRAGLFTLADIVEVPILKTIVDEIDAQNRGLDESRRVHETVRRLITRMIEDVVAETDARVAKLRPRSVDDVRNASSQMVGFSPAMASADTDIKAFLYPRMYRHERVTHTMVEAEGVVRDLFAHYNTRPADMPAEWAGAIDLADEAARVRQVADFIAGMTDRYALIEHEKHFRGSSELR